MSPPQAARKKFCILARRPRSQIEIHISFQDEVNQYEIRLTPTAGDQLSPVGETVYFWDKEEHPDKPYNEGLAPHGREAGISNPNCKRIANYVRGHLQSWRVYHFQDTSAGSPMKKTASLNDNRYLRPDGSNLAAFLYFLRQKHQAAYEFDSGSGAESRAIL